MRIGKYQIFLGRRVWFQTRKPSIFRYYHWFTIIEEVDLTSITQRKKYTIDTEVYHEGRRYRYYKAKEGN